MDAKNRVTLVVIDGLGCRSDESWNAVASAKTPCLSDLFASRGWTTLGASGPSVGLPVGQMGNSEVGHLNIGAGRVVDQDVVRISRSIENGELGEDENFQSEVVDKLESGRNAIHLIGLLSEGGVHSLQSHLHGLIRLLDESGVCVDDTPRILVHAILDGRDTAPRSARDNVESLEKFLENYPCARLASMVGRYYAMDRDNRWDRIRKGYDLMTMGMGTECTNPVGCIDRSYEAGISDEFIPPITVADPNGLRNGKIEDGDVVVFFNFRADRMRQIVSALSNPSFDGFDRIATPDVHLVTMNRYHEDFSFPVLFPPAVLHGHLGEVISQQGLKQLRIAETEKYAHVTFFFNGGSDTEVEGEERILVSSPSVDTYDLKPSMSVVELTDRVVEAIREKRFDLIVMNIANPDMVGHTGMMDETVEAVEATDASLARIVEAVEQTDGICVITADHGNSELMFDESTQQPHTAHTTNPVPLIVCAANRRFELKGEGALANVAPTILELMGLEKPPEMTSESLLVGVAEAGS